ncbi:MAG: hypothetical protein MJA83_05845 [Gammaproteobacteria bacterium]|nr:hypothetical protein [Gammaproteobacteria bacterium]
MISERARDDPKGFAALGVEVQIDIGGWVFVLTANQARAAHWCGLPGHVGITPNEVAALGRASGGQVDRDMLVKIACVKRTFPGAHIMRTLRLGETEE